MSLERPRPEDSSTDIHLQFLWCLLRDNDDVGLTAQDLAEALPFALNSVPQPIPFVEGQSILSIFEEKLGVNRKESKAFVSQLFSELPLVPEEWYPAPEEVLPPKIEEAIKRQAILDYVHETSWLRVGSAMRELFECGTEQRVEFARMMLGWDRSNQEVLTDEEVNQGFDGTFKHRFIEPSQVRARRFNVYLLDVPTGIPITQGRRVLALPIRKSPPLGSFDPQGSLGGPADLDPDDKKSYFMRGSYDRNEYFMVLSDERAQGLLSVLLSPEYRQVLTHMAAKIVYDQMFSRMSDLSILASASSTLKIEDLRNLFCEAEHRIQTHVYNLLADYTQKYGGVNVRMAYGQEVTADDGPATRFMCSEFIFWWDKNLELLKANIIKRENNKPRSFGTYVMKPSPKEGGGVIFAKDTFYLLEDAQWFEDASAGNDALMALFFKSLLGLRYRGKVIDPLIQRHERHLQESLLKTTTLNTFFEVVNTRAISEEDPYEVRPWLDQKKQKKQTAAWVQYFLNTSGQIEFQPQLKPRGPRGEHFNEN